MLTFNYFLKVIDAEKSELENNVKSDYRRFTEKNLRCFTYSNHVSTVLLKKENISIPAQVNLELIQKCQEKDNLSNEERRDALLIMQN